MIHQSPTFLLLFINIIDITLYYITLLYIIFLKPHTHKKRLTDINKEINNY